MASNKNADYYIGVMRELDEEFEPLVDLFEAIDDMVRPSWNLPAEFTAVIKDVMAVVDTAPSDAINSGAIALSGSIPIISVSPFMPNKAEYDRTQTMEEVLSYHFEKSNVRGNGSVMYDIADSSLRYNTICVQAHDLARILPNNPKDWTPMQRAAWRQGRFIYEAHNPKDFRYRFSTMGLTLCGYTSTLKVQDVIDYWSLYENQKTDEAKRIAATLKDLRAAVDMVQKGSPGMNGMALGEIHFTQTYVIDYDKLVIFGSLTDVNGDDISRLQRADFIFADQDNPYGFIPFSVRVAGSRIEKDITFRVNPLLAPLYWSKSWDKLNLAKSIIFSEPIRRARNPRGIAITQSGEAPNVDYENGNEISMRTGEDYKPFQALTLDPNALAVVNALEAAMNRTTGASMIGDTTKISSNTPFSTFSAMVKVALSRLDKQRLIMGDACVDMQCLALEWANKTDVPLTAYLASDKQFKTGTLRPRGTKLEITKKDFNLDYPGISCRVVPSTATDEMEQLNMAILLSTKLNYPVSQSLEKMGYKNVGLSYELWAQEFLKNADLQAQAAGMAAKAQAMAQLQAQQEAQAAIQGQQGGGAGAGMGAGAQKPTQNPLGAGGGVSNAAFGAMGGSTGTNPAFGGTPPAQGAPTMTREAVTGQNRMQR